MIPPEKEQLLAQIRATPSRVMQACWSSCLLGLVMATRVIFLSPLPLRKALFFAGLMLMNFVFGGWSLVSRKRGSYVSIAIFAVLPLYASFLYSVHLCALVLSGEWFHQPRELVASIIGTLQMVLIVYLYRNLFSREVRTYVWKRQPQDDASAPMLSQPENRAA